MTEKDCLQKESIRIDSKARSKEELLREISSLVCKSPLAGGLDANTVYEELQQRETICSTGFENGIAIPHCFIDDLSDFIFAVDVVPEGIDFHSHDGKPSRIFLAIVAPTQKKNKHIFYLSRFSKLLSLPETREKILEARDADAIIEALGGVFDEAASAKSGDEKSMVYVLLQKMELLDDILQIFTDIPESSTLILEGKESTEYLQRIPLFANLWEESRNAPVKILLSIIDRSLTNELLRRVDSLINGNRDNPGFMVVVQNQIYTKGHLNL